MAELNVRHLGAAALGLEAHGKPGVVLPLLRRARPGRWNVQLKVRGVGAGQVGRRNVE